MAYQVLARKYRPQSFDDLVGQEVIARTLKNAIEHERLHHAYIFCGTRGSGKTSTARILAKAMNCQKAKKPTLTPCTKDPCDSCREITNGKSMDVLEFDAASTTGVENVRNAIIATSRVAPSRDRFKIFIIDECHMITNAAFNALLKTIEEPPPRIMFIMATTEEEKIPETIASRCQLFPFKTIPAEKIASALRTIAKAEKVTISTEALIAVSRAGDGSMRDAQSAFDTVISYAGDKIEVEDVKTALGLIGSEIIDRVIQGIADNKPVEALAIVEDIVNRGLDLRVFCKDVLERLRDLLFLKFEAFPPSPDGTLEEQAEQFSQSDLTRMFNSMEQTEAGLKNAANPRYRVEIGLVKLMEMKRLAPIGDLIQRVDRFQAQLESGNIRLAKGAGR